MGTICVLQLVLVIQSRHNDIIGVQIIFRIRIKSKFIHIHVILKTVFRKSKFERMLSKLN